MSTRILRGVYFTPFPGQTMKKLLLLILIVGGGVGVYYFTTGHLPMAAVSEDEQKVARLNEMFNAARTQFRQSNRASAVSGIDTSGMGEGPASRIDQIQQELKSIRSGLTTKSAKDEAEKLQAEIDAFRLELK